MAKIIGPDFLALQVRHLEASRTFYTEQLGLELAPQSPPHAVVFAPLPWLTVWIISRQPRRPGRLPKPGVPTAPGEACCCG
jgi:catechol 2,3-dioxygenase-like lactoylglutathione lyase family enzyme